MKYAAIKYFTIFTIASSLAALMIFGCSTETGRNVGTTDNGGTNSGSRRSRSTTSTLDCSMPSGGSTCEGDEDCEELCEDNDHLNLSGSARKECFDWPTASVEKLDEIFKEIKDPEEDKLNDLTNDDINLLCAAIEMEEDFWLDEIKGYTPSDSKYILKWIINNEQVTFLLDREIKEEDRTNHLKYLLVALADSHDILDDMKILEGLGDRVDTDDDENVIEYAESAGNEDFIKMVHELIVEEGICDVTDNQPTFTDASANYQKSACMLGVYCHIIDDEGVRKSIAEIINNGDIKGLIESDNTGGLDLGEEDAEEWTTVACAKLVSDWADTANLDLGL